MRRQLARAIGIPLVPVLVLGAAVLWAMSAEVANPLRGCGHRSSLLWRISPLRASHHCCDAGLCVTLLRELFKTQCMLRDETDRFASSAAELESFHPMLAELRDFEARLELAADSWSCSVGDDAGSRSRLRLPGGYRLDDSGVLQFQEAGSAECVWLSRLGGCWKDALAEKAPQASD